MGAKNRTLQIRELPWRDLTCCSCWRCVILFYGEFFGLATAWAGMPCGGMSAHQALVIQDIRITARAVVQYLSMPSL
jgi:hypothetical protein